MFTGHHVAVVLVQWKRASRKCSKLEDKKEHELLVPCSLTTYCQLLTDGHVHRAYAGLLVSAINSSFHLLAVTADKPRSERRGHISHCPLSIKTRNTKK